MNNKLFFSNMSIHRRTPEELKDKIIKEFHNNSFFDPCPLHADFDGLQIDWKNYNFVNPPYGKAISAWLKKGIIEKEHGRTSVFLLPVRSDTKWFHTLVLPNASEIKFIEGRLIFAPHKDPAPFPSMLVIFKK